MPKQARGRGRGRGRGGRPRATPRSSTRDSTRASTLASQFDVQPTPPVVSSQADRELSSLSLTQFLERVRAEVQTELQSNRPPITQPAIPQSTQQPVLPFSQPLVLQPPVLPSSQPPICQSSQPASQAQGLL